jgi:hypothetical protein
LAAVGCFGGDELERHQVSGTVTFQGTPVENGAIVFEPDISVGPLAPTTYARIERGEYETVLEDSPTRGAYQVRVTGVDEKKRHVIDGVSVAPPIFREHILDVQIPPPDGRLDIVIPDERAIK